MTTEIHDGIRIRIEREYAAPPERLFRAFVDPDEVATWMWVGMGSNPRAEIDLRVGGRYRIVIDDPDDSWPGTERAMEGVFIEIIPDRRLAYTLHWDAFVGYNAPGMHVLDEAVIVDFEPTDTGTRVVLQHVGIPDDGMSAAAHAEGIGAGLDMLATLVAPA
jgi:uncharacterized protein YndB with AHSA1/START domain